MSTPASDEQPELFSCALCGTMAPGPPLTWMSDTDSRRGRVHYCDRCARENLRAVEAKLDQEWW